MNWALNLARHFQPTGRHANLFGVVLYTNAHVWIVKMLADPAFWDSLHEISGDQWTIFSAEAARGHHEWPRRSRDAESFMCSVWREPEANRELLEAFQLPSTDALPSLLVFAEDSDGTPFCSTVRIEGDSVDAVYRSLREAVETITQALAKVHPEFLRDGARAFHTVGYAVRDLKEWRALKKTARVLALLPYLRRLALSET